MVQYIKKSLYILLCKAKYDFKKYEDFMPWFQTHIGLLGVETVKEIKINLGTNEKWQVKKMLKMGCIIKL